MIDANQTESPAAIHVLALAILSVVIAVGRPGTVAAQPAIFNAFLVPETTTIVEGDTARVDFEVDETAVQFNGYRVVIRYNPEIVDFVPPVVEGVLMTGACGSTFPFLTEPDDSTLVYQHAIVCGGAPLSGPGQLSAYRFAALAEGTSPIIIASHPDSTFTDAGVWVNPDHPTFPRQVVFRNAGIEVRGGTGIAIEPVPPVHFRLGEATPNPSRLAAVIRFELGEAGWVTREILDVHGRPVWSRRELRGAGSHLWRFDRTDLDGTPLPSGVYFYRLVAAGGAATRKLVLIH